MGIESTLANSMAAAASRMAAHLPAAQSPSARLSSAQMLAAQTQAARAPAAERAQGATLPARLSAAANAVLPALRAAADRVGVDFTALFNTARVESGFNPDARARTSSATGLFQFLDSTWLSTIARHGPRHGITPGSRAEALALRRDPAIASLMAAEHMAENATALSARLGRAVDSTELYLAHFLGVGGATRFLGAMARNPVQAAADILPAAARANKAIFTNKATGEARSLGDVFALLRDRLAGGVQPPSSLSALAARQADAAPFLTSSATTPVATPGTTALNAGSLTPTPEQARRAAHMAYLLLADLGAR